MGKSSTKRFLALLLVFAMILQYSFSVSFLTVYADGDGSEAPQTEETDSEAAPADKPTPAPEAEPEPEPAPKADPAPAQEEAKDEAAPAKEEASDDAAPAEEPSGDSASEEPAEASGSSEAVTPQEEAVTAEEPAADAAPEEAAEEEAVKEEAGEEETGEEEAGEEIGEEETEEETVEEETAYPAQHFTGNAGGVSVVIDAPEGALPEDTKMSVKAVSADEVQSSVEAAIGADAAAIRAVDITFSSNGKKIEPKKAVSVKLSASGMANEANQSVVHIADNGAAEVVTGNVSDGSAAFSAKDFSIYLVVEEEEEDPEENAVATYEFYVDDELVMTQYIKTGDTLTDPGTSVVSADDANTVFKGWFIGEAAVDFSAEQTVDETVTIRVDAKLQHTYYVTFWGEKDEEGNRGIIAVKSVTVEGSESGTVDTADVSVTPKKDTSAFKGWALDNEGTEMAGDSVEVSEHMDLYAVVVDAYWLHFYENVGEDSDSDATYTGPVFIAEDEVRSTKKPADPTREGYEFGGWYLEESCETAFDWDATGLDKDTDLYAKWTPGEADFTVIVWKQKVTDAKDTADSAKTYDFEVSAPWTGTTGETLDLSQFSMYEELDFTGFHYGRMEAKPETVKADGTPCTLSSKGRHDPCVLPRAVPVCEAMAYIVLADFLLLQRSRAGLF